LTVATSIGATALGEEQAADWAKEFRPDVVVETVGGDGGSLETAISLARRGARLVILGSFGTIQMNIGLAMGKELTIIPSSIYGTGRRGQQFASAVELLPRWRDALDLLLTHQFPLVDVEDAFRVASDKTTGALKVTVTPQASRLSPDRDVSDVSQRA